MSTTRSQYCAAKFKSCSTTTTASPRRATSRAVRFGLYAAGWDLVVGPLGAIVMAFKEGVGAALSIASVGVGLPGRSARAFLRGCYGLTEASPVVETSHVIASAHQHHLPRCDRSRSGRCAHSVASAGDDDESGRRKRRGYK